MLAGVQMCRTRQCVRAWVCAAVLEMKYTDYLDLNVFVSIVFLLSAFVTKTKNYTVL